MDANEQMRMILLTAKFHELRPPFLEIRRKALAKAAG